MPTASERQALAFLTAVALLGGGVRVWQSRQFEQRFGSAAHATGAGAEAVDDQLAAVDGARSKKGKRGKGARPKVAIVDVDVATSQQLEALPRIGPSLAERIVANRDSFGAFGSLEALGRVRGIGVAMRAALEPLITFSAMPSSYVRAKAPPRASAPKAVRAPKPSKNSAERTRPKRAKSPGSPR